MAGTVSQKPQGLEEGQTGHGMTSGIVGDPWNQPCGWELPAGPGFWTSGSQESICTPVGLGTLLPFDFLSPFLGEPVTQWSVIIFSSKT